MARSDFPSPRSSQVASAGDRIFEVASRLFYENSIRSVGVDTIVKNANVTKITLYRKYSSKDDLIFAYLRHRSAEFLTQWDERFDPLADDPAAQLRAIMTYVADRTTTEGYRGCPFNNFCAEFPDPDSPGRKVAQATKEALRDRFFRIAVALRAAEPEKLSDALLLLTEGAYALSQTVGGGPGAPGHALVWAATALVDSQQQRK